MNFTYEPLLQGGVYIALSMTMNQNAWHWGLYHHRDSTAMHHPLRGNYTVHRGMKYHIRNLAHGWIADHQQTSGLMGSMSLIGVMRIGMVPFGSNAHAALDQIARSVDTTLNTLQGVTCRVWVLHIIGFLITSGVLRPSSPPNVGLNAVVTAVETEAHQFAQQHAPQQANHPRPIIRSRNFL